ncbi:MAG: hypothetical protein RIB65_15760 [Ilumatobacter fluminis]|uniref:hypothetical protein n=1 Tax=Ilumatobacter fluminis TaxID=467091 RepID=UPI0032F06DFB
MIAAQDEPRRTAALTTWHQIVTSAFAPLVEAWHHGQSFEIADGLALLIVDDDAPHVSIEVSGPPEAPHPMHVRSLIHVLERLRAPLRREAAVSLHALDQAVDDVLSAAITAYPVDSTRRHLEAFVDDRVATRRRKLARRRR